MASGITTYTHGPYLFITRDITKADFMHVCDQMGYWPEPINEGGFKQINAHGYKSLRIQTWSAQRFVARRNGTYAVSSHNIPFLKPTKWPWITWDTVAAEWRGNNEVILYAGQCMSTFLKASQGATLWTRAELEEWSRVLGGVGIVCSNLRKVEL